MTNSGTVLGKLGMLFILCLLSVVCQAQPVILSTHNTGVIDLALHLEKFPDPSRELTIDDIRELPDASWQQNELPFISGPVTHDAIWFRFTVQTRKPGEHRWVLQSRDSLKQQFDLWILRDGKVAEHLQARPAEGFSQRVIQHRDFVFPVELSDFSESVFYIRVTTNQRLVFPLELMPERLFHERDQFHLLLMAMNAGIMLVMLVYNLFIYFSTRDISYLYYGGIVITAGLFFGSMNGLAYQYIWPDLPETHLASNLIFGTMTPAFAALFTIHFLNIRERLPLVRRFLLGYVACSGLIILFPILGDYRTGIQLTVIAGLIGWLTFFGLGIQALIAGIGYARYYTLAWAVLITSLVALYLGILDLIPFSYNLVYINQAAFTLEVMLNSLALANRINWLEQDRQQAIADSRAKMNFLAKMSHEIRTPMNGILGMAELLGDRLKNPTNLRYIQIIQSSTSTLLTIINDILDYTKIESGKMELEHIEFEPRKIIDYTTNIYSTQTLNKPVELIGVVDPEVPERLKGDPTRLGQILINLTSNALKFTQRGAVVIRLELLNATTHEFRLSVEDTGTGIPLNQQDKLFEAFQQADSSISRSYGGTGLGLTITRQLAELMDGNLSVKSAPGEGAKFSVNLQMEPASEAPPLKPALKNKSILLIEPNPFLGKYLEMMLNRWGASARWVSDYRAVWSNLYDSPEEFRNYDLICIDDTAVAENGPDLTQKLKGLGLTTRLCLLYHNAASESVTTLKAASFHTVQPKPHLLDHYQELIIDALSDKPRTMPDARETEDKTDSGPSLRILVGEDNNVNQLVIRGLLKKLNHSSTIVDNGKEVLRVLEESPDDFDLILMDCEMPVLNGFEATRALRSWEENNHRPRIPVIALTAHILPEQKNACLDAGMDEMLTKPVQTGKLQSVLNRFSGTSDG